MEAKWETALRQALPKNLGAYKELQQNEQFVDNSGSPAGINSFNFVRDLQWNNVEKEIEAILDSVFRFWDQKDMNETFSMYGKEFVFNKFNTQVSKRKPHYDSNDKNQM